MKKIFYFIILLPIILFSFTNQRGLQRRPTRNIQKIKTTETNEQDTEKYIFLEKFIKTLKKWETEKCFDDGKKNFKINYGGEYKDDNDNNFVNYNWDFKIDKYFIYGFTDSHHKLKGFIDFYYLTHLKINRIKDTENKKVYKLKSDERILIKNVSIIAKLIDSTGTLESQHETHGAGYKRIKVEIPQCLKTNISKAKETEEEKRKKAELEKAKLKKQKKDQQENLKKEQEKKLRNDFLLFLKQKSKDKTFLNKIHDVSYRIKDFMFLIGKYKLIFKIEKSETSPTKTTITKFSVENDKGVKIKFTTGITFNIGSWNHLSHLYQGTLKYYSFNKIKSISFSVETNKKIKKLEEEEEKKKEEIIKENILINGESKKIDIIKGETINLEFGKIVLKVGNRREYKFLEKINEGKNKNKYKYSEKIKYFSNPIKINTDKKELSVIIVNNLNKNEYYIIYKNGQIEYKPIQINSYTGILDFKKIKDKVYYIRTENKIRFIFLNRFKIYSFTNKKIIKIIKNSSELNFEVEIKSQIITSITINKRYKLFYNSSSNIFYNFKEYNEYIINDSNKISKIEYKWKHIQKQKLYLLLIKVLNNQNTIIKNFVYIFNKNLNIQGEKPIFLFEDIKPKDDSKYINIKDIEISIKGKFILFINNENFKLYNTILKKIRYVNKDKSGTYTFIKINKEIGNFIIFQLQKKTSTGQRSNLNLIISQNNSYWNEETQFLIIKNLHKSFTLINIKSPLEKNRNEITLYYNSDFGNEEYKISYISFTNLNEKLMKIKIDFENLQTFTQNQVPYYFNLYNTFFNKEIPKEFKTIFEDEMLFKSSIFSLTELKKFRTYILKKTSQELKNWITKKYNEIQNNLNLSPKEKQEYKKWIELLTYHIGTFYKFRKLNWLKEKIKEIKIDLKETLEKVNILKYSNRNITNQEHKNTILDLFIYYSYINLKNENYMFENSFSTTRFWKDKISFLIEKILYFKTKNLLTSKLDKKKLKNKYFENYYIKFKRETSLENPTLNDFINWYVLKLKVFLKPIFENKQNLRNIFEISSSINSVWTYILNSQKNKDRFEEDKHYKMLKLFFIKILKNHNSFNQKFKTLEERLLKNEYIKNSIFFTQLSIVLNEISKELEKLINTKTKIFIEKTYFINSNPNTIKDQFPHLKHQDFTNYTNFNLKKLETLIKKDFTYWENELKKRFKLLINQLNLQKVFNSFIQTYEYKKGLRIIIDSPSIFKKKFLKFLKEKELYKRKTLNSIFPQLLKNFKITDFHFYRLFNSNLPLHKKRIGEKEFLYYKNKELTADGGFVEKDIIIDPFNFRWVSFKIGKDKYTLDYLETNIGKELTTDGDLDPNQKTKKTLSFSTQISKNLQKYWYLYLLFLILILLILNKFKTKIKRIFKKKKIIKKTEEQTTKRNFETKIKPKKFTKDEIYKYFIKLQNLNQNKTKIFLINQTAKEMNCSNTWVKKILKQKENSKKTHKTIQNSKKTHKNSQKTIQNSKKTLKNSEKTLENSLKKNKKTKNNETNEK